MREIFFRGFTPDEKGKKEIVVNGKKVKGEWVQGSYWKLEKTTYCFKEDYEAHPDNTEHYIVFSQMTDWGLPNQQLKADVIPETVGQYTGLTDKNGKKIFEGDVLDCGDRLVYVEWHKFCGTWDSTFIEYKGEKHSNGIEPVEWKYRAVVIGNIHDNPELLEKEKKEYFSPEEVRAMSREEVKKNYSDILRSMKEW